MINFVTFLLLKDMFFFRLLRLNSLFNADGNYKKNHNSGNNREIDAKNLKRKLIEVALTK